MRRFGPVAALATGALISVRVGAAQLPACSAEGARSLEGAARAAFLVDTLMHVGLTPLTILREVELPDGVRGSLMYFVADAEQSAVHFSTDGGP